MSSRDFERKWKTALTSILEELSLPEFRKFIISLDKIPQGRKTETHREEFPDIIIQFYGTEGSISVINKEMKVLPRKDAKVQEPLQRFVEEVKKRRQKTKAGGNTAAPSRSTSAAAPPAASMMAQDRSNIIAPNIAGSTIGTLNINITK